MGWLRLVACVCVCTHVCVCQLRESVELCVRACVRVRGSVYVFVCHFCFTLLPALAHKALAVVLLHT